MNSEDRTSSTSTSNSSSSSTSNSSSTSTSNADYIKAVEVVTAVGRTTAKSLPVAHEVYTEESTGNDYRDVVQNARPPATSSSSDINNTGTAGATGSSTSRVKIVIDNTTATTATSMQNVPAKRCVIVTDQWLLFIFTGLVGGHHYALGRAKWGTLYLCTLGCFGWGWLCDFFRISLLLASRDENMRLYGTNNRFVESGPGAASKAVRLGDMYVLWIFGLFGVHHLYAGRKFHFVAYLCTLGLFGVGWVADLVRMPYIFTKTDREIGLLEAYIYLIPCGLFGLHHLYLGDKKSFWCCLFTLNYFGVGFALDLFRLPWLFQQAQDRMAAREELNGNVADHIEPR